MGKENEISASDFKQKMLSGEYLYTGKGMKFKSTEKTSSALKAVRKQNKVKKSDKIDLFQRLLKQELNLDCIREYQFNPDRKWRADYMLIIPNDIIENTCDEYEEN